MCLFQVFFAVAEWFQHPSWRWARTSLFLCLGMCGVIPLIHVLIARGYDHAVQHLGLWFMVSMGVQYVVGAMLYGFRWPERQWPGRFDFWGQSHQVFHMLVVTAALTHWVGVVGCAQYWHEPGSDRWICPA
jgi:adiponectin receptor